MTRLSHSAALVGLAMVTLSLHGCDKSSSGPTNSAPPTPAKASSEGTPQAQAQTDPLKGLGVELLSFEELRAKAQQAITAENADAEFEQLQLEVEANEG